VSPVWLGVCIGLRAGFTLVTLGVLLGSITAIWKFEEPTRTLARLLLAIAFALLAVAWRRP
jgi:hypothetical protein